MKTKSAELVFQSVQVRNGGIRRTDVRSNKGCGFFVTNLLGFGL
jgi:hypothetical protein